MEDAVYYCAPYAEPHEVFRAFLLAHPDADVEWTLAEDGTTEVLLEPRTERAFQRWHRVQQDAAIVPLRGALWMREDGLAPWGWPPV
jgi:hypothetical protein